MYCKCHIPWNLQLSEYLISKLHFHWNIPFIDLWVCTKCVHISLSSPQIAYCVNSNNSREDLSNRNSLARRPPRNTQNADLTASTLQLRMIWSKFPILELEGIFLVKKRKHQTSNTHKLTASYVYFTAVKYETTLALNIVHLKLTIS